jgi:hypothetical protein
MAKRKPLDVRTLRYCARKLARAAKGDWLQAERYPRSGEHYKGLSVAEDHFSKLFLYEAKAIERKPKKAKVK